ncbi:hypothetical protein [Gemmobacter denitrificans]|uniref:Uncharacterized protein n=1 Tax=Gemmobacter denitrificans TaxID=3123040 RepID=A0ABU8C085_9RHOB
MRFLRPDPHPCDLAAWQQRLAELQDEPQDDWRDSLIDMARLHIAALEHPPEKSPTEGLRT